MKLRHKVLVGVSCLTVGAGIALAQVPALFLTSLTGTEQFNVLKPSTGTVVTSPQILTVTASTLKSYIGGSNNGVNPQTGTSYTFVASDCGKLVTFNNASAIAVSLPQATGDFASCLLYVHNIGAGQVTITPTTSTINGAATYVINRNRGAQIFSDSVNYQVQDGGSGLAVTPVAASEGGTGATSLTSTGSLIGGGTGPIRATVPGTNGQVLVGNTTADPYFSAQLAAPLYTFGPSFTGSSHIATSGSAPALTSCGTGPAISGTDTSGTITMGTGTPTGCVITFATAYTTAPHCVVTWRATPLASQSYAVSNVAITLTQTATSSNLVDYSCIAPSGG